MATTTRTPPQGTQTNLFGQINFSFLSITIHSYNWPQQQSTSFSSSSASCHAVLAFIVPVLLTFLQIKYQGKDTTPFDIYPKSFSVSIASLLLYCISFYDVLKSSSYGDHRRWKTYARHGTVVFGWLGLVPLASILLPDSVRPLLYFLYILFLAGEFLHCQLQMLWNLLHQIVMGRVPVMPSSQFTTAHAFLTQEETTYGGISYHYK